MKKRIIQDIEELRETNHTMVETLPIGDKVLLNIGCGTGEAPLLSFLGAENYIGIDYSYTAAKVSLDTLRKLKRQGITAQSNAESLPIRSGSIDLIYSNGVLHHTPETQKTLDEVYRVLKPRGKAVIGLYSTYSSDFIIDRIVGTVKSYLAKNRKEWYEYGEGAWETDDSVNPWTKTYSRGEMKKLCASYDLASFKLRACGFHWGNAIPILGKYIHKTKLGRVTSKYLDSTLGAMWVLVLVKK